jgi:hypothetical protein
MPSDDIPRKLLQLLLELIASGELPELAVGGAWHCVEQLLTPRPALAPVALEADICGLAAAGLRTVGPAAEWVVSIVSSYVACKMSAMCCQLTGLRCLVVVEHLTRRRRSGVCFRRDRKLDQVILWPATAARPGGSCRVGVVRGVRQRCQRGRSCWSGGIARHESPSAC